MIFVKNTFFIKQKAVGSELVRRGYLKDYKFLNSIFLKILSDEYMH